VHNPANSVRCRGQSWIFLRARLQFQSTNSFPVLSPSRSLRSTNFRTAAALRRAGACLISMLSGLCRSTTMRLLAPDSFGSEADGRHFVFGVRNSPRTGAGALGFLPQKTNECRHQPRQASFVHCRSLDFLREAALGVIQMRRHMILSISHHNGRHIADLTTRKRGRTSLGRPSLRPPKLKGSK